MMWILTLPLHEKCFEVHDWQYRSKTSQDFVGVLSVCADGIPSLLHIGKWVPALSASF